MMNLIGKWDEHHREHLKELGLFDEEENPGEEFISRQ